MQFNYSNCDVQIFAEIEWKIFSYNIYKKHFESFNIWQQIWKKKLPTILW